MARHARKPEAAITPRYHIQRHDGLYAPIAFLFVSRRMCNEILVERALVLELAPANRRKEQQALLQRYDPRISADAFGSLLSMFNPLAARGDAPAPAPYDQPPPAGDLASDACGLRNTSGDSTTGLTACACATASSTRPWAGDLSHTGSAKAGSPASM